MSPSGNQSPRRATNRYNWPDNRTTDQCVTPACGRASAPAASGKIPMKPASALLTLLLAAACVGNALADDRRHDRYRHRHSHNHGHFGIYIGAPLTPWFAPPPVYHYPPRIVVVPAEPPPVYIEQYAPQPPAQYWYYCREAGAYYPQVGECRGPWQRVLPTP